MDPCGSRFDPGEPGNACAPANEGLQGEEEGFAEHRTQDHATDSHGL